MAEQSASPIDAICKTIQLCFKWTAIAVSTSIFSIYGLGPFAGATTKLDAKVLANILVRHSQNKWDSAWLMLNFAILVIGVMGFLYGVYYKRLYHGLLDYRRHREQKVGGYRHEEIEKELNPSRTSSELTENGKTRPEDK